MTNNDMIEVDPDTTFQFCISGKVQPSFKMTVAISEWLVNNLSALKDDNDKIIFNNNHEIKHNNGRKATKIVKTGFY